MWHLKDDSAIWQMTHVFYFQNSSALGSSGILESRSVSQDSCWRFPPQDSCWRFPPFPWGFWGFQVFLGIPDLSLCHFLTIFRGGNGEALKSEVFSERWKVSDVNFCRSEFSPHVRGVSEGFFSDASNLKTDGFEDLCLRDGTVRFGIIELHVHVFLEFFKELITYWIRSIYWILGILKPYWYVLYTSSACTF